MSRLVRYAGIVAAGIAVLAAFSINRNLAALAEFFVPGSLVWAHAVLWAVEALGALWLLRGLFWGGKHLRFSARPTEEERRIFVEELTHRLRNNPHVRDLVCRPGDEEYLPQCLDVLRKKADEEIRRGAERIFLATALSQNGRLDAVIVFVSLCRLIWRISSLYNQKPHPSEIVSLYAAVTSSTFIAFSLEEMDIATEIGVGFSEVFNSVAPAAMTSSVPFVGVALQKFTSSAVDGAANGFLALRAGIITRNAYAYTLAEQQRPTRAAVFREAGGMLMEMSGGLLGQFSKSLSGKLWDITRAAPGKTLDMGLKAGINTGQALVDGVTFVGEGLSSGVGKLAGGAVKTVQGTVHVTGAAIQAVGTGIHQAAGVAGRGVQKIVGAGDRRNGK